MTRTLFTSAALLAALMALPLDAFAQGRGNGRGGGMGGGSGRGNSAGISIGGSNFGGSRSGVSLGGARYGSGFGGSGYGYGGSGFGIGLGRGGVYIGPTRGYGYGYGNGLYGSRYGSGYGYGYPGYWGNNYGNSGYGGYYNGNTYSSGTTYSQAVPVANNYEGPGVAIRNATDQTIHFTLDDQRQMSVGANETIRLTEAPQFLIAFDRGSRFGSARYTVHEGLYEFTPTQRGWELFRQKADTVAVRPNESAVPHTAARPVFDAAPNSNPLPDVPAHEFRGENRDIELPSARDLPPPVPQADNLNDD